MTFFRIFSLVQGALSRRRWALASPSTQYSILRKTISMKMVCGQTQPQKRRPNTTVNKAMKTTKVSMATTNK